MFTVICNLFRNYYIIILIIIMMMTITMMIMMTMLITLPLFTLDSIYSAVNLGARKGEIWPIPPLNVTALK